MRKKPIDANEYDFDMFENWLDENGVGELFDDWSQWWECWKTAYHWGQENGI